LLGPALFTLALAHALRPSEVALDWQTTVLVLVGAVAVAVPDLPNLIRDIRVKVGDTEITLRMDATARRLKRTTDALVGEVPPARTAPRAKGAFAPAPDPEAGIAFTPAPHSEAGIAFTPAHDLEARILDLASRDKETAVMRLGVEIERGLQSLVGRSGVGEPPPRAGWIALAESLEGRGVAVPARLKDALRDFAEIRDAAAHGVPVSGRVLNSALDSGLRLTRVVEYLHGAQDGEKSA
jgi:hypothetical protein